MIEIIVNGGKPLPGCPASWNEADAWETDANIVANNHGPKWRFDCGFKLDYDCDGIVWVSSRFYPPKEGYGPTWDGTVTIGCGDMEIYKRFDCLDLESLRKEVESYVQQIQGKLQVFLQSI